MKAVRVGYLVAVMGLACAQVFVALSPRTAPAFAAGNAGPFTAAWFMLLFGAWIVAGAADLVMSVLGLLPLSFGLEAVLCNVSLALLLVLPGGIIYILCALAVPTIILVKAIEEISGHSQQLKHV